MPDNAARYRDSKVAGYRRWVRRLTLTRFIVFMAVVTFAVAAAVSGVLSVILTDWSFSWSWIAIFTVLMTAFWTWWRRDELRQARKYPADHNDQ